ncbi:MAG: DUF4291 family protein [Chloroflexota bacterium]
MTSHRVPLRLEDYAAQARHLPVAGCRICAHYDDASVVVFKAWDADTVDWAAATGTLEGTVGYAAVTDTLWFTPSFLSVMYESRWLTEPGSDRLMAIVLERIGFDAMLLKAVHADYRDDLYSGEAGWRAMMESSWVRLRWLPDRGLRGRALDRQALHLGLRGKSLRHFANGGWVQHIEDVTEVALAAFRHIRSPERACVPVVRHYPVATTDVAARLGVDWH